MASNIQLSEHFDYKKLIRFVLPSVGMMVFTSVYGIVDGLFVSNYVGKVPFAAINLVMPLLMMLGTVGFMIGAGGSAVVAKTMGEGKPELANRYFTMLIIANVILGAALTAAGQLGLRRAARLLGADGAVLDDCVLYGRIIIAALPAFMLQNVFQSFLITAERPKVGLGITVAAGLTNMALDFLFVAVFRLGIAGAAFATALSQAVGGIAPLIYFIVKKDCALRFVRTRFYPKVFFKTCANGSSELMTNISSSFVSMLYNFRLMELAGENGVAAYGVIMYVNFFYAAVFIGYSIGAAPIISYHYGAGNRPELKNLFRKSLVIMGVSGTIMAAVSFVAAGALARFFVGYDAGLCAMTARGMRIFAAAFIIMGYNVFSSGFFTALNNGFVSAVLSFMRTFVLQVLAVLIFPAIFKMDGIWIGVAAAELAAFAVSAAFFAGERKRYGY